MGKFSCYRVQECDKKISDLISNWTPYYVSTLRALYDERNNDGKESDWDKMDIIGTNGKGGILNTLIEFNQYICTRISR